jgi:hypothetical protein
VDNELNRQASKREQILNVLRSRGLRGITNAELSNISLRYGGHLGKLYELGYKIRKDSLGSGLFSYTLIEEPSREQHDRKKAIDALLSEVRKEEIIDAGMLESMLENLGIAVRYKPNTYNQLA